MKIRPPIFPLLILAFSAMRAGACFAADPGSPVRWWIADPLAKVKPLDPFPGVPVKTAVLYARSNEFEPFQLVLCADRDVADVDIRISDLRSKGGATIPGKNVVVYFERFLNIMRSSVTGGAIGPWPDPLIPQIDQYTHEKRNAFPFVLRRGLNQPLWIETFVPQVALPGKYTGSAYVTQAGKDALTIPISITVWAFVLPSTATLRSSFGLNGIGLLKQHFGKYTNDDDLYALTHVYARAALQHRISIHGGSMAPPKFLSGNGKMHVDWGAYDTEVGPFMAGTAIPAGEPLFGARATSVELRMPTSFPGDEQRAWYLAESVRHFQQSGWYDRLFLYLWDEPAVADYPKVLERGLAALRAVPGLRNLVTVPFTGKLEKVVRIWTPLVNCLERKPGFDDFCAESPPMEVYSHETRQSRSLWFYQSCASHGCNIPGGAYFTGWPSYMIDASGTANRVMQWLAWKYRVEGELYFSMNEAYGSLDPWTDVRLFGGNGDGTLFYPGRAADIGGLADIPVESIRLKLIREGMEDYEYLALLSRVAGKTVADEYASRIVTKSYLWESRPEVFLRVRQEMGETLDRLVASRPQSGSDGN